MRNRVVLLTALSFLSVAASAQSTAFTPRSGEIELFMGAELHYRDIDLDYPYDFLINLTPGIKWHLPYHIQVAAQAQIPVVNDYGSYYRNPRLNVLAVSQQIRVGNLALKPSVGLFTQERYGVDLKALYPLSPAFALEAQVGLTGYLSMAQGWNMSSMGRLLALAGADVYLRPWNVQLRAIGGRFLGTDYGVYAEGMRHFRHCTVGLWADYSDKSTHSYGFNGGFKITMMIPPYRRAHRKVTVRPASNFLFSFNMNADNLTAQVYQTDPEENVRETWFTPDITPWGPNTMDKE